MAMAMKKSTNLTGMPVMQNARKKLLLMYSKILNELTKMPELSSYRRHTETLIKHRAAVVEKEIAVQDIEEKIGCGQIEELIIQAKNELELARKLIVFKPWEPLKTEIPPNQWKWPPN